MGLLAAALLLLAAVSGHAQDQRPAETSTPRAFLETLSPQERAWLRDHPVIRVAQDPSWPPIEFTDERGAQSGMTADYLRLVEERLGVKFERVPNLSWQEAYARLQRWEIDLTTTVAVTAEREKFWAFTKPYMTIPIVVVTRADVTYIADLRELAGKKVAVVEGYVAAVWIARDFPEIQLVRVKTTAEALALLQRGEVLACVENMLVVGYYLAEQKMTDFKIAGTTPYNNAQCMAVRKDWAPLAGILDHALDSVSPTEREAIYRRWLPLLHERAFNYTRLWQIVASLAALFLGSVAWNWKLAREIRERKQAEAALRTSEAKFRAFVTTSSDVLYRMSPDWREMRQLDGRGFIVDTAKPSDRWSQEYIHAEDQPHVWAVINEAVRTKRIFELEHRVRRVDGTLGWTFSRAIPLLDAKGEIVEWFGAAKDVTEHKQAEAASERARQRLNEAQRIGRIGDWEFDLATQMITWSPQVFEILGRDPKLGPPQDFAEAAAMYEEASKTLMEAKVARAIESGEPQDYELLALRPDGGRVQVQARAVPIKDASGKVMSLHGTVQDITERREAEEALRQSRQAALNLMTDAIEARARSEQASLALRASEENNRTLFREMQNGFAHSEIICDAQGRAVDSRYLAVNPAFERITGRPAAAVVGRTILEVFPALEPGWLEAFGRVALTGEPALFEMEAAELGITFDVSAFRPAPNQYACTFTDITARKQADEKAHRSLAELEQARQVLLSVVEDEKAAAEQLRKLSAIIEQAPLSVVITDLAGAIEYVNPRFSLVSGYTSAEVLGQNPRVLKSGETSPENYRAMWAALTRGEVWTGELSNRTKSGELYLEAAVIAPVVDEQGRVTHYVALKDDITAKQRHETDLTAKLEQEHAMSEMKTRFISVTSHEFRTPMAAAMGSVEILANHLDRLAPAKRRELLDRITASLHRMTEMLDEILLLNRIDANRVAVRLTSVDLRSFAQNVLEEIRLGDRDAHRFEFSASGETAAVVTDPNLLHHILSNLLSNAVRYSPAATLVTLRLAVAGGRTQIAVEDQGIGIPEADRPRIFEPFERGSNVGAVKGTGLGLNIVQRMTGLLGGTVALAATAGGGCCFTLDFPPHSTPAVPV